LLLGNKKLKLIHVDIRSLAATISSSAKNNLELKVCIDKIVKQGNQTSDIVLQLLLLGFAPVYDRSVGGINDFVYAGITYSLSLDETKAFNVEPILVYALQHNKEWNKFCNFSSKLKSVLISFFHDRDDDVKRKAREVFTLLCLLQYKNELNKVFQQYDYYKNYTISSTTILHGHDIDAGALQASSLISKELCHAKEESKLSAILAEFACFPFDKHRADAILFAKRRPEVALPDLPLYIPVIISMNAYRDNHIDEQHGVITTGDTKDNSTIQKDYWVTSAKNFFSHKGNIESKLSTRQNQIELEETLQKVENSKYVRVLVHPWVSSSETDSLAAIVTKVDQHELKQNNQQPFVVLNNKNQLVIRLCKDSDIVTQWYSHPVIGTLMEEVEKSNPKNKQMQLNSLNQQSKKYQKSKSKQK